MRNEFFLRFTYFPFYEMSRHDGALTYIHILLQKFTVANIFVLIKNSRPHWDGNKKPSILNCSKYRIHRKTTKIMGREKILKKGPRRVIRLRSLPQSRRIMKIKQVSLALCHKAELCNFFFQETHLEKLLSQ
jgi:hypothetical protein